MRVTTSGAPIDDQCILYPIHIQEIIKRLRPTLHTELGACFTPKRTTRVKCHSNKFSMDLIHLLTSRTKLKLKRIWFLSHYSVAEEEEDILFGSNGNDNEYDNIEHLNRARFPENPEVNQTGHPSTYNFMIIINLLGLL